MVPKTEWIICASWNVYINKAIMKMKTS